MQRVLVVGDLIQDHYKYGRATKICPEAPALVVEIEREVVSEGGAGLVAAQLRVLLGEPNVEFVWGSVSAKGRLFADRTLVVRLDKDSFQLLGREYVWEKVSQSKCEVIVISDYGKGTFDEQLAQSIIGLDKPVFVDSKHNMNWWKGAFCAFPNEFEACGWHADHIIRKRGARGCVVDGVEVPTEAQLVYDVTGAGDIFMAAFVSRLVKDDLDFVECAKYANKVAGISVRHLGTYVVSEEVIGE